MEITPLNNNLINGVIDIAKHAGVAIMDIYHREFDIYIKDDNSPLTEADKRANEIIIKGLKQLTSDVPILST